MQVHLTSTTAALYQFKYPTLAPVAALVRLARSWWIVATQLLVRSPGHNGTPTPLCISSIGVVELRPPPPTESPEFTVEVGDVPMFWLYMWWYWYMRYMIPYMMICNMWYVIQEYTVYMITVLFCGSCLDLTPKIPPISVFAGSIRCLELSYSRWNLNPVSLLSLSDSGTLC